MRQTMHDSCVFVYVFSILKKIISLPQIGTNINDEYKLDEYVHSLFIVYHSCREFGNETNSFGTRIARNHSKSCASFYVNPSTRLSCF